MEIRFTLLAEGTSDRVLVRVVTWAIEAALPDAELVIQAQFVDLGALVAPRDLARGVASVLLDYPCDLLVVHQDEDGQGFARRLAQISRAAATAGAEHCVPIVPVRMTEAWLLFDAAAIRRAADNPGGRTPLPLPKPGQSERLADPKTRLEQCLLAASGRKGRARERFQREISFRRARVGALIDDFRALRSLPAFQDFEARLGAALTRLSTLGRRAAAPRDSRA